MAKAKKGWIKCDICGAKMRAEKLASHMRRVHPKGAKTTEERRKYEERRRTIGNTGKILVVTAIIVAVIVVVYFVWISADPRGVNVGDTPPNFVLMDQDGFEWVLDDHLGDKPIVLDFMSTTCGFCQHTAGELNKIYDDYQDQVFVIIIISGGAKSVSDVREWAIENAVQSPVLFDKDDVAFNDYKIPTATAPYGSFPTTYFIDKEGKVYDKSMGDKSYEDVEKIILELI